MKITTASGEIILAAYWARARRKFHDFYLAIGSPNAVKVLYLIADNDTVEKRIRGRAARARH